MDTIILIVEDDENSRELLEALLTSQGFKILSATNGFEAWNLLQKDTPDLIISDILMPEMDGFTLCRKCKETEKLQQIPFVFYTATYTDDSEARYAHEIGATKFLIKPMEVDLLLTEITKILDEYRSSNTKTSHIPKKENSELDREYTSILTQKVAKKNNEVKRERRRVEMSEAQYRQLVEFAPIGIMRFSLKGELQSANRHLALMLGYTSPEDMIDRVKNVAQDIYQNCDNWKQNLELIRTNGQGHFPECSFKHSSDKNIWVEIHSRSIIVEDGSIEAYEAFIIDITERKQAEECKIQSEKMKAIGALAAGLAHEVSTPCHYIQSNIIYIRDNLGLVQDAINKLIKLSGGHHNKDVSTILALLENGSILTEIINALNDSEKGIEHISEIVHSVNQFSHPSNNQMTSADLNASVSNSATMTTNEWKYHADLKVNLDQNLPFVPCIVDQIHQVIINLVINAVHAIEPKIRTGEFKKGTITLETSFDDSWVTLTCTDNGTGIPEAARKHIFEPFFTTKGVGKGTGQGLAIAYTIVVKNHGGELSFTTEEGKGTTFIAKFPREPKLASQ